MTHKQLESFGSVIVLCFYTESFVNFSVKRHVCNEVNLLRCGGGSIMCWWVQGDVKLYWGVKIAPRIPWFLTVWYSTTYNKKNRSFHLFLTFQKRQIPLLSGDALFMIWFIDFCSPRDSSVLSRLPFLFVYSEWLYRWLDRTVL